MNKDIRIDLSFSNHGKRKKLFSILGAQGVLSLIDLWLKTAENRPKGILTGTDETDIALDVQWPGDPHQFCQAVVDTGFLERDEKRTYSIHDWKDHQRYAYFADERSQRAREAVEVRWSKRDAKRKKLQKECGDNTERIQTVYGENTEGNTPSPYPSPSPNTLCPHQSIVDLYHKILPELPQISKWTPERLKKLLAFQKRDPKRQEPEWWGKYFEAVRESSFLLGYGPRGWRANIDWLLKEGNFLKVKEGHHAGYCQKFYENHGMRHERDDPEGS